MARNLERLQQALRVLAEVRDDSGAWETIFHELRPVVFSIARRRLSSEPAMAEDVTQEVFARLAVYCPFHRFADDAEGFQKYVATISTNVSLDVRRAASRRRTIEYRDHAVEGSELIDVEVKSRLDWFNRNLEGSDRRLLHLVLQGLKISEIARLLDISPGTASVRLHRLRHKFSSRFKR